MRRFRSSALSSAQRALDRGQVRFVIFGQVDHLRKLVGLGSDHRHHGLPGRQVFAQLERVGMPGLPVHLVRVNGHVERLRPPGQRLVRPGPGEHHVAGNGASGSRRPTRNRQTERSICGRDSLSQVSRSLSIYPPDRAEVPDDRMRQRRAPLRPIPSRHRLPVRTFRNPRRGARSERWDSTRRFGSTSARGATKTTSACRVRLSSSV